MKNFIRGKKGHTQHVFWSVQRNGKVFQQEKYKKKKKKPPKLEHCDAIRCDAGMSE